MTAYTRKLVLALKAAEVTCFYIISMELWLKNEQAKIYKQISDFFSVKLGTDAVGAFSKA